MCLMVVRHRPGIISAQCLPLLHLVSYWRPPRGSIFPSDAPVFNARWGTPVSVGLPMIQHQRTPTSVIYWIGSPRAYRRGESWTHRRAHTAAVSATLCAARDDVRLCERGAAVRAKSDRGDEQTREASTIAVFNFGADGCCSAQAAQITRRQRGGFRDHWCCWGVGEHRHRGRAHRSCHRHRGGNGAGDCDHSQLDAVCWRLSKCRVARQDYHLDHQLGEGRQPTAHVTPILDWCRFWRLVYQ